MLNLRCDSCWILPQLDAVRQINLVDTRCVRAGTIGHMPPERRLACLFLCFTQMLSLSPTNALLSRNDMSSDRRLIAMLGVSRTGSWSLLQSTGRVCPQVSGSWCAWLEPCCARRAFCCWTKPHHRWTTRRTTLSNRLCGANISPRYSQPSKTLASAGYIQATGVIFGKLCWGFVHSWLYFSFFSRSWRGAIVFSGG